MATAATNFMTATMATTAITTTTDTMATIATTATTATTSASVRPADYRNLYSTWTFIFLGLLTHLQLFLRQEKVPAAKHIINLYSPTPHIHYKQTKPHQPPLFGHFIWSDRPTKAGRSQAYASSGNAPSGFSS